MIGVVGGHSQWTAVRDSCTINVTSSEGGIVGRAYSRTEGDILKVSVSLCPFVWIAGKVGCAHNPIPGDRS
jgi:hypothetical protein